MNQNDIGLLLNQNNLKLHRHYFNEMVKLNGIQVLYRAPREGASYNGYGELDTFYYEPVKIGCLFDEHPNQWTTKKFGWNSEQSEGLSIIQVPYDLKNLQEGALFIIPSAIDNAVGRVFKVVRMSTTMIVPASVACEIGPVIQNSFEKTQLDFKKDNFTLLREEDD